jgi:hypothetical protein
MSALHLWNPTRDEWEDEGRALDAVLEGRVCVQTDPALEVQIDLPRGFAPWPPTVAEAREIRRWFKVTARQVVKEINRTRVLSGAQRTEAAREARRTQGEATAVLIISELEEATAGKLEAAVQAVCEALKARGEPASRATVFRAKRLAALRE